jgi:NAD(P)-dependent dehydrogenase (short-subunit alcohol dehydrogenase family)
MLLDGKVAIVTGGTSGIGLAIAERFVAEGAKIVVVAGRNEVRGKEAESKLGGKGFFHQCDTTNYAQVQGLVGATVENFGRVDALVASAGAFPARPFLHITPEEWEQVIHENLDSAFYSAQAAAKQMVKQRYGRIIFISSAQGLRGIPLMAHYTASKGGIIALTRCIGSELGPNGITVNTIAAGLTITPPVAKLHSKEEQDIIASFNPTKRLAYPEEMAGLAALLASEEGRQITCQTIAVDGGLTEADAVQGDLYANAGKN